MWILLLCLVEGTSVSTFETCQPIETYEKKASCHKMLTEIRNVGLSDVIVRRTTRTVDEAYEEGDLYDERMRYERRRYSDWYDNYTSYEAYECASKD